VTTARPASSEPVLVIIAGRNPIVASPTSTSNEHIASQKTLHYRSATLRRKLGQETMLIRFYVATEEELRRLPHNALEERVSYPQFAGTRQKAIQATYEWRSSQLYLAIRGHYLNFDDHGTITVPASELRAAWEVVHVAGAIELQRANDPTVVRADHYRRIKELKGEREWKPSEDALEVITIDLLGPSRPKGTKAVPILKPLHL
jgi:hypothetical protein